MGQSPKRSSLSSRTLSEVGSYKTKKVVIVTGIPFPYRRVIHLLMTRKWKFNYIFVNFPCVYLLLRILLGVCMYYR